MDPVSNNLSFQEQLKNTYLNNKSVDDLSYQELNTKENQVLFSLKFNLQQNVNHNKSYGQLIDSYNKNMNTIKYYTDSQFQKENVDLSPGIPASKIEQNSKLLQKEFRNSCRGFPTPAVNLGYMGLGSNSGDITISSQIRNNVETNIHKTQKPSINNLTDWTFQIFDPQVLSKVAPNGINGDQSVDNYGDISRY